MNPPNDWLAMTAVFGGLAFAVALLLRLAQ
jgi:hypothetical protein